jgi:hypothetical protein
VVQDRISGWIRCLIMNVVWFLRKVFGTGDCSRLLPPHPFHITILCSSTKTWCQLLSNHFSALSAFQFTYERHFMEHMEILIIYHSFLNLWCQHVPSKLQLEMAPWLFIHFCMHLPSETTYHSLVRVYCSFAASMSCCWDHKLDLWWLSLFSDQHPLTLPIYYTFSFTPGTDFTPP